MNARVEANHRLSGKHHTGAPEICQGLNACLARRLHLRSQYLLVHCHPRAIIPEWAKLSALDEAIPPLRRKSHFPPTTSEAKLIGRCRALLDGPTRPLELWQFSKGLSKRSGEPVGEWF